MRYVGGWRSGAATSTNVVAVNVASAGVNSVSVVSMGGGDDEHAEPGAGAGAGAAQARQIRHKVASDLDDAEGDGPVSHGFDAECSVRSSLSEGSNQIKAPLPVAETMGEDYL